MWHYYIMALGMIGTLAALLLVGKLTLVPLSTLLRTLALCCVVLLLIPFRFTAYRWGMERFEWILFNVLGLGPIVFSGALLLNFFWYQEPMCRTHAILRSTQTALFYSVELEGDAFAAFPGAREFGASEGKLIRAKAVSLCTARGILGADVVVRRDLLVP